MPANQGQQGNLPSSSASYRKVCILEEVQSGDWGVSGEIFRNGQGQREGVVTKDGIYKKSLETTALKMALIHLYLEVSLLYHEDGFKAVSKLYFQNILHASLPYPATPVLQVEQDKMCDHEREKQDRSLSLKPDWST